MSNKRFYVGNIPWDSTESDLRDVFSNYDVADVKIITDRETQRSRGFGFVELRDISVEEVIADMDGREFMGRQVKVNEAQQRPGASAQRWENPKGRGPARGRPRPRTPRGANVD